MEQIENTGKKKPAALRVILGILKTILFVLLGIIVVLLIYLGFSIFDKKQSLYCVPRDFSVYVHTDNVYQDLEPVVDLEACDVILGQENMSDIRGAFMAFRASPYRKNPLVKKLVSCSIDACLYPGEDLKFCGVVDLGVLSAATRLARFVVPFLNIDELSYNSAGYITYKTGAMDIYVKPYHNLAIVSNNVEILNQAASANAVYSNKEKELIRQKSGNSISIFADTTAVLDMFGLDSSVDAEIKSLIKDDTLSVVNFNITDNLINLKAELPLNDVNARLQELPILKNSTVPKIVSKLPGNVQYYTLMNAGSFEELKTSAFTYLNNSMDVDALWQTSETVCKSILGLTLEDLLFSWTGSEVLVLGIEGQNDPVFALEVKDEKQRLKIFETVLSSFVLKEDNSLILDGRRLNRLEFPSFIQNILKVFGVNLTLPYYMVKDNYIYFSQSSECLSGLYSAAKKTALLKDTDNFAMISNNKESAVMLSLFYNLKKTVPFFVRSHSTVSQVLSMYPLGRCDVSIRNSSLILQIGAISSEDKKLFEIPGFPKQLDNDTDGMMAAYSGKGGSAVFWKEGNSVVKSLTLPAGKIESQNINENFHVVAVEQENKDNKAVWVVTSSGVVYLYNTKLEAAAKFPIESYVVPCGRPVAVEDKIVFNDTEGVICTIDLDGNISYVTTEVRNAKLSRVNAVAKKNQMVMSLYDKGFVGNIYMLYDSETNCSTETYDVLGIGFGCPAVIVNKNDVYTAFITQAGDYYLWHNDILEEGYPCKIDGVFYTDIKAGKDCFYVLSETGVFTKLGLDGSITSVQINNGRGSEQSVISLGSGANEGNVYVCADSNVIYGFDSNMELLYGFPLTGWGQGAFGDINGDNKDDYFVLGLDNCLYAYNLN